MICNPPSKNVRPIKIGGFVIPQYPYPQSCLLRISNPQSLNRLGHFFYAGFQIRRGAQRVSRGAQRACVLKVHRQASRRICNPPSKNVRPIKIGGFVIPQYPYQQSCLLRISNPQSLNRLGYFFYAGFQIRRDAQRACVLEKVKKKKVDTSQNVRYQPSS